MNSHCSPYTRIVIIIPIQLWCGACIHVTVYVNYIFLIESKITGCIHKMMYATKTCHIIQVNTTVYCFWEHIQGIILLCFHSVSCINLYFVELCLVYCDVYTCKSVCWHASHTLSRIVIIGISIELTSCL